MSDFKLDSVTNDMDQISNCIHPSCPCNIRVVGVGGGGCNTLQHMINQKLSGVEFISVNTDSLALTKSTAHKVVQIGVKLTNGLGAGCDPQKGRKAAEESREKLKELLHGSDMVFITAGMGGGTGTGASPIIAELAQEAGALTVAVVTKPFKFEGKRHMVNAEVGISELSKRVDSIIVIDNDKLLKNLGANISIVNAFNEANDVLLNAVKGITDSITKPGFINLDFADVTTVMSGRGHAMIGNGVGKGANFVEDAIQRAIHSPLIEQVDISSAAGLLANAIVNPNFPISKWEDICNEIQSYADEDADCKFGLAFDDKLAEDEISITILIAGISGSDLPGETQSAVARAQASIRHNSRAQESGFYSRSQDSMESQSVSAPASPLKSSVNPFAPSQSQESSAMHTMEPQEVRLGEADDSSESQLWEVPPVLRNRAD